MSISVPFSTMKHLPYTLMIFASLASAQDNNFNERFEELDPLVIESTPLDTNVSEITRTWSVLNKSDLEKAKSVTIAETLANQPGIHQSFFGPSSNRPIIRGLDKHRVRMLQNGVESFDFSTASEDHAVSIDPMFVERIEMLRGSSALLYGSSAIGGAVNVIDRSIPTRSFAGSPGAVFRSGYNSVNNGWKAGAMGFAGTESLSFQINGFTRNFDDYDAPDGFTHDGTPRDKVLNSMGESHSYGLGGSHLWDGGYAGMSFSQLENVYGVPGEHAENETRVELESDRFEARSEIEITDSDWLRGIELSFGYGDYRHDEIGKEDGAGPFETHASYLREGIEARTVLVHEIGSLRGALGFHGLFDDLKIQGEENGTIFSGASGGDSKPISAEESSKLAVFLIEEFELSGSTRVNGGIRWEIYDRDFESEIADRDDSTFSASGGISHDLSEGWNLSANLSYTERAPETSELYSDGPHHATEAFEIGNSALDTESAVGFEVILRRTLGRVTGQLSAFHNQFDNYVFLEDTDENRTVEGGEVMKVKKFESAKAEFQGLEAKIDWLALENPSWSLLLSAYGDLIRAKNESEGTYLPRIPPARLGVGFEVQAEKLTLGMNMNHVFKQNKISVHEEEEDHGGGEEEEHDHGETPTASYSLLNAYASYDLNLGSSQGELFLRGFNLTDELARVHTSFLKDSAPLPGAGVEVGLRIDF